MLSRTVLLMFVVRCTIILCSAVDRRCSRTLVRLLHSFSYEQCHLAFSFPSIGKRLQRDIKRSVDARLRISENLSEGRIKVNSEQNHYTLFVIKFERFLCCYFCSQNRSMFKSYRITCNGMPCGSAAVCWHPR